MNENDSLQDMLDTNMSKEIPEEVRQAMAQELRFFTAHLAAKERYPERRASRIWALLRPAMAVAMAGFAFLMVAVLLPAPKPTWAQVMESLASIQTFDASIYVVSSGKAHPVRLELAMSPDGGMRLLAGDESVLIGPDGSAVVNKIPGAPDPGEDMRNARLMVQSVLERFRSVDGFTFDELVSALRGSTHLTTPLESMEATISPDLAVFDMYDDSGEEHIRIHALRKSRLPMRVFYQDSREGILVDAILSYERDGQTSSAHQTQ